jgi:DNA-binding CsgD family transcriptional regulator
VRRPVVESARERPHGRAGRRDGVARPRRLAQTGASSLTPGERRVAQLAANGLTNKQIAQALFVTTRTVEMNLGNAYRKLDISSRDELAPKLD